MILLFWIAVVTLILSAIVALDLMIGNRMVRALRDVSPLPGKIPLRVSIIVPARNEQRNIREALNSLLEL
jgi:cellulose synthase/poly-beta-1,6-N-acetylglucosamine synthase-like glycosyltransferase